MNLTKRQYDKLLKFSYMEINDRLIDQVVDFYEIHDWPWNEDKFEWLVQSCWAYHCRLN